MSGQKAPDQKSMTYTLWRDREGKLRVSAPDQKSMTYKLWRGQRRQAQSEWTEDPKSEINDLHTVEGPETASSE